MKCIKEACVENFEDAMTADKNGADRIELCSNLNLDGLTPSKRLVTRLLNTLKIPMKVMIRPREGDFCYNSDELRQMHDDISYFSNLGVFGVVFGVLNQNNSIDVQTVNFLVKSASGLNCTFHKAIDETDDIVSQLKILIKYSKISSILSSGCSKSALSGSTVLQNMIKIAKSDMSIICAGSITHRNFSEVHSLINAKEYHGKNIIDLSK